MKPKPVLLFGTILFLSCGPQKPAEITGTPPTGDSIPDITAPVIEPVEIAVDTIPETEAERLLSELNSWPEDELDAYERPGEYPGLFASGETVGWVETHKELLKDEGIRVKWNTAKKIYEAQ
jgi:hypothetical protein